MIINYYNVVMLHCVEDAQMIYILISADTEHQSNTSALFVPNVKSVHVVILEDIIILCCVFIMK